jgi:hypothetical protein
MRRSLCLYAVLVLAGSSSPAIAQAARQQGGGRSGQDTLPANVVKGAWDAYTRQKNVDAAFAFYDTVFTHQYLDDSSGAKRIRRDDWVRQYKADTGIVRAINTWRMVLLHREVYGAWVNDIYLYRTPEGKEFKHFDLYEVRHGKIVREIEGP